MVLCLIIVLMLPCPVKLFLKTGNDCHRNEFIIVNGPTMSKRLAIVLYILL